MNHVLVRGADPQGKGNFGDCLGHSKALVTFAAAGVAAAFTAKESIRSLIMSPEGIILSLPHSLQMGSVKKRVMGVHSAGKV